MSWLCIIICLFLLSINLKLLFYFLMILNNTLMVILILMESSYQQVQCLELLKTFLSVQEVRGMCLLWEIHCVFLKIFRYIDIDTKKYLWTKKKNIVKNGCNIVVYSYRNNNLKAMFKKNIATVFFYSLSTKWPLISILGCKALHESKGKLFYVDGLVWPLQQCYIPAVRFQASFWIDECISLPVYTTTTVFSRLINIYI